MEEELIEQLAALEHEQWIYWSKAIAEKQNISEEKLQSWRKLWIPYKDLSEEDKEHDRKWARKVLDTLKGETSTNQNFKAVFDELEIWDCAEEDSGVLIVETEQYKKIKQQFGVG